MQRALLAITLTFLAFLLAPFPFYGALAVVANLEPPSDQSPLIFLASVVVQKLGHAIAFVLIFVLAARALRGRWLVYALLWWLAFALDEIGQALGWSNYTWPEAAAGVLSEGVYFPLAAWLTRRLCAPSASPAHSADPPL